MDAKPNDKQVFLTTLEKEYDGPIMTEDFRLKTQEVTSRHPDPVTGGNFTNERQGTLRLLELLRPTKAFHIYHEVSGTILQPRPGTTQLGVRCDLLLTPTKHLLDHGYHSGAICIECKANGKKIGPAICQAMDYARSAFSLPSSNIRVVPSYCFVWHMGALYDGMGSITCQHNVGSLCEHRGSLRFLLPGGQFLGFDETSQIVKVRTPTSGRRAGSR